MVKRIPGVLQFPILRSDQSLLPTRDRPSMLYVHQDLMAQVLKHAILAIKEYQNLDEEDAVDTQSLIRERENFLAWVKVQPGPKVYLGIHPVVADEGDINEVLPDFSSDVVH